MALEPPLRALSDIVQDVEPSLVCVKTPTQSGSGFVIDYSGNVITNAHVVEHHKDVSLDFVGNVGVPGVVLGVNRDMDLACLRVTGDAELTPVSLGDSDLAQVGEDVFVMGFPISAVLNAAPTVTRGIISARHSDSLQTDAAINPGNSGGPLVDARGQVIGVNTSVVEFAEGRTIEGIGFAIPINAVKAEMKSLTAFRPAKPRPEREPGSSDADSRSVEWIPYSIRSVPLSLRLPPEWHMFHMREGSEGSVHFNTQENWYFTLGFVSTHLELDSTYLVQSTSDSEQELLRLDAASGMECTTLSRGWVANSVHPTWHYSYVRAFAGSSEHIRTEVFLLHSASGLTHIVTADLQAPFGYPRDDALMARRMREFLDTVSLM